MRSHIHDIQLNLKMGRVAAHYHHYQMDLIR